jgi:hypothetical protein
MFLGVDGAVWLQTIVLSFFTGGISGFVVYVVLEWLRNKRAKKIMDAYKIEE